MVCAARLTQRGHCIKSLDNFMALYKKSYKEETAFELANLPHPTLQKLGVINIVILGASRRFLAQITRHQNEVKFISASLQYSNYDDEADFVVPYAIIEKGKNVINNYISACAEAMDVYHDMLETGLDNDTAGYIAPQGLRNILIVSATPYQWKHMIRQRACRRNTAETRYVMLRIWESLFNLCPSMFKDAGPACVTAECLEGKMRCGEPVTAETAKEILETDFPLLMKT